VIAPRAPSAYDIPWGALRYPHVAAIRAPATVNKVLSALRGVAREAMRLGQLDAGEYTKIADVEGLRGTRLPAGRHVEMPEPPSSPCSASPASAAPSSPRSCTT